VIGSNGQPRSIGQSVTPLNEPAGDAHMSREQAPCLAYAQQRAQLMMNALRKRGVDSRLIGSCIAVPIEPQPDNFGGLAA
jgi:hypothetical protein